MSANTAADAVIVCNPQSGTGDHVGPIEKRATLEGMEVRETQSEGQGRELARQAAAGGASLVVAAGGDGTLNEVVAGVADADALDSVTVAVIPVGTGNNFAGNVGIGSIDEAFHAIEDGERRRLDLGWANDRPFVNSCVGGLTADASGKTDSDLKSRLGVLAYFLTTLETAATYEKLALQVSVGEQGETPAWEGEAIAVLAGNGRRFTERGSTQANLEDGLLEVTVVHDVPTTDIVRDAIVEELFSTDSTCATHLRASAVEVEVVDGEPMTFSLDGEILEARDLTTSTQHSAFELVVGEDYEPNPDAS